MASLESCLLPGARFDFSENNLANHMGSRLDFEGRSDARLSTAYFARWDGPVLERDDPYPRKGRSPEGLRPVRHVQEVLYLPDRQRAARQRRAQVGASAPTARGHRHGVRERSI